MKRLLKKAVSNAKARIAVFTGAIMSITTSAFAEADTATVTSMTAAFEGVKDTGLAALGAIGVVGIALFAGVYAWKYGKKIFKVISG